MISYIEKGNGLSLVLHDAGYSIRKLDGAFIVSNRDGNQSPEIDAAVQAIIDSYNPLPEAQADAISIINTAAGKVRTKYATDIPFQTEAYNAKLSDAKAFKAAGYVEADLANYPYTNARALRQGTTGQVAADFIIAIATGWDGLMFAIEDKRDAANEQVSALKDWSLCEPTAKAIIAEFEDM